jgi:hypothetical protein
MLLLILILIIKSVCAQQQTLGSRGENSFTNEDSILLGVSLNGIMFDGINCNYSTTCTVLLCNTLSNQTLINKGLAFVSIIPTAVINNKVPFVSNTTMIIFIFTNNAKFATPQICDNVGECFNKGSILFNSNKNSLSIGFMGQCL